MKKTAGLEMTIQLSPIVFKWALSIANCLRIIGTSIRMLFYGAQPIQSGQNIANKPLVGHPKWWVHFGILLPKRPLIHILEL